jgi:N-acetylglucosaminyldiphosphoundecaprenol N-acetyl-beta-D-mannosaminyltransferase
MAASAPALSSSVTEPILGYAVERRPAAVCVADMASWAVRGDACRWLACLNPHSYVVARDDAAFAESLRAAHWLVPDGQGIVLASRWLGGAIRERLTGSDVFSGVMRELNRMGGASVFFLGSTEATLAAIRARAARDYPSVRIAGAYSPPFKAAFSEDDIAAMIDAINAAAPDVLWVGMTAPKQEKWLHAVAPRLKVRFAAAIGAVFDFYAGRVRRSHPGFQRLGLEWLPRLLREPRRLWRRNFVSTPVFLACLLRARLGSTLARGGRT